MEAYLDLEAKSSKASNELDKQLYQTNVYKDSFL